MSDMIAGFEFAQKLIEAGFNIPNQTKRIVIDIKIDEVVVIYYETYASIKTMDVVIEQLIQNKNSIVIKEVADG